MHHERQLVIMRVQQVRSAVIYKGRPLRNNLKQRNQENIKVGHDIPIRDMFVAVEKSSDIQMPASIRDVLSRYDELNLRRVHVV